MIAVAEAVGRVLGELGVAHVFGVIGSGNYEVTNALIATGVPYTAARHEMGAASMADAYTRTTGNPSVVSVHQGCGLTNALTGIGEAAKCHTPILVLTGDTAVGDETSNFAINQDEAVRAVGAIPLRIHSAASAVRDAVRAFEVAILQRATVVLSLPVDLQDELVDETALEPISLVRPSAPAPAPESVRSVVELLRGAKSPLIVGGRGAVSAAPEIRRLADACGALLVASGGGRGIFEGDDWALDIMGGFATEGAADLITEADLMLVFGASLNTWTARGGVLTRNARIIQVDDRLEAFGRHRTVDLEIFGDARLTAAALVEALGVEGERTGFRTPETAERIAEHRYWSSRPHQDASGEGLVDPVTLTNALDAMVPRERIVIPDGGNVNCYPGAHLRVPDVRGYCLPLSFQAIGLGLACGIGAGVGQPHRLPVVGTGDGAFMMSAVELDTAVRLGLGMLVIVYNDSAYGAELHLFASDPEKERVVRFPDTDIAAIARGYGCEGVTVRTPEDLAPVEAWLQGPRIRPLVIDAKISGAASWLMRQKDELGSHRAEALND